MVQKSKNILFATSIMVVTSCQQINPPENQMQKPNLVFVFADQWRTQDLGYMGNTQVRTPALDKLAKESANFTNAVSTCPVCSPFRASLLTGQYPLTHGIFYNDKPLDPELISIGDVYKEAGYATGYIGKWHLNGPPKDSSQWANRSKPVPRDRRQGFDYWKVLECTHNYNNSIYYDENDSLHQWNGYDAIEQTKAAIQYIHDKKEESFVLFLSWGPPHAPYQTAPAKYQSMYADSSQIKLRGNVPDSLKAIAQKEIAGYYAHIAALDDCIADLQNAINNAGIANNTIFVFTSDHGDMLRSHGKIKKQKPWDESVHIPYLVKFPAKAKARIIDMPVGTPDYMPTLLGLCSIEIPESAEGTDYSKVITGEVEPFNEGELIQLPIPFHQWGYHNGGVEWRGVRTSQFTYAENLEGGWLLYDNNKDPYQLTNEIDNPEYEHTKKHLAEILKIKLEQTNDKFLPGDDYMKLWDYDYD